MDDVVTVAKDGRTYALFFRRGMHVDGARFFTPEDATLQVGYFSRPAGYAVQPHKHAESDVHIRTYAEFLYIESGKAQVTIYDEEWNVLAARVAGTGDFLLFLAGGHGVEMLEPTRFIEVKQGPYPGNEGAKVFRFLAGEHSVEMLEPTQFIEAKQSPCPGDENAKFFRVSA